MCSSTCVSNKGPWSRVIRHFLIAAAGLTIAILFTEYDRPLIGWFIGGIVMALASLFTFVRSTKRWSLRNVMIIMLSGVVAASVYYTVNSWSMN